MYMQQQINSDGYGANFSPAFKTFLLVVEAIKSIKPATSYFALALKQTQAANKTSLFYFRSLSS